MGKGDKRTRRGKIYRSSYGNKRPQRNKKTKKTSWVQARPTASRPSACQNRYWVAVFQSAS